MQGLVHRNRLHRTVCLAGEHDAWIREFLFSVSFLVAVITLAVAPGVV